MMASGKQWYKRAQTVGVAVAMAAVAGACATQKDLEGPDVTDRVVYDAALEALKDANYARSAHLWEQLDRDFPLSDLSERALMLEIFTHYQQKNYEASITAAERFLSLHPRHAAAGYAAYMRAMNYSDRVSDVERSMDMVQKAVDSFQDVARIAPGSRYAQEAAQRIADLQKHRAAYAMLQGRQSLTHQLYGPALRHFYEVVERFPGTPQATEAHYRLVETYVFLNDTKKAMFHADFLKRHAPGTIWGTKADAWLASQERGALSVPSLTKAP